MQMSQSYAIDGKSDEPDFLRTITKICYPEGCNQRILLMR